MQKFSDELEVPVYYIEPESMREQSATVVNSDDSRNLLPLIDLASSPEGLVEELRKACEVGSFQIINHGLNPDLIKRMARKSEEFFLLPTEEKVLCNMPKKQDGPVHFERVSGGECREVLKIICKPASEATMDRWPLRPSGFRDTLSQYVTEQEALARWLLKLISESLGLAKDYIENECAAASRVLVVINHYPPCPGPSVTMGIQQHSDPSTITILQQDQVPGLQLFKDGQWFAVKPVDNALFVNVGDHMQILSDGRYSSCLHRVVNSKTEQRTSLALFFSPNLATHIQPAPALVDEEHPAKYEKVRYRDLVKQRRNVFSRSRPAGSGSRR